MTDVTNKVVLVHVHFPEAKASHEDLQEFEELAKAAGAEVISLITGKKAVPEPKYFVGKGKAEEIKIEVLENGVSLVIFNHELTPAQERNLEKLFECRVLDRTGLILDIFAQRARSFAGVLQVELAQLQHLSTRLVRGWSHLERQRGGIGLRGPGETQLEVDRRLLRNRIKAIKKRLEKVHSQRQQSRRARKRADLPTISLVGYTNAGKSTLFNKLTTAKVYVADKLFATLDPTLRRIELSDVGGAVLADTVGFIRHLPHDLVDAFHATLEETEQASLLLHVIDINDPERREKIAAVEQVLSEIGADTNRQLLVYNKIDLVEDSEPRVDYGEDELPHQVFVSSLTGAGLDLLLEAINEILAIEFIETEVTLRPAEGKKRAMFYELGTVLEEHIDDQGNWHLKVRIRKRDHSKILGDVGNLC